MVEETRAEGQKMPIQYNLTREEEEQILMESKGNLTSAVRFAFQYGFFKGQVNRIKKDSQSPKDTRLAFPDGLINQDLSR